MVLFVGVPCNNLDILSLPSCTNSGNQFGNHATHIHRCAEKAKHDLLILSCLAYYSAG